MTTEGHRYDVACETAAHVVNTLQLDRPKAVLFQRVLMLIQAAILEAESRSPGKRLEPSDN